MSRNAGMVCHHDLRLVVLSIVMSIVAAFAARELHDDAGQALTAAKINLKIVAPDVPGQVSNQRDDSVQLLDRLLKQVRKLSLNLHPPLLEELGLVPTLFYISRA